MLSFVDSHQTYGGQYIDGVCLTTDDKPIEGIANGSRLKEVNPETGEVKRFQFDAESMDWIEITSEPGGCSGGGSSGGSGEGMRVVDVTLTNYDDADLSSEDYDQIAASMEYIGALEAYVVDGDGLASALEDGPSLILRTNGIAGDILITSVDGVFDPQGGSDFVPGLAAGYGFTTDAQEPILVPYKCVLSLLDGNIVLFAVPFGPRTFSLTVEQVGTSNTYRYTLEGIPNLGDKLEFPEPSGSGIKGTAEVVLVSGNRVRCLNPFGPAELDAAIYSKIDPTFLDFNYPNGSEVASCTITLQRNL